MIRGFAWDYAGSVKVLAPIQVRSLYFYRAERGLSDDRGDNSRKARESLPPNTLTLYDLCATGCYGNARIFFTFTAVPAVT